MVIILYSVVQCVVNALESRRSSRKTISKFKRLSHARARTFTRVCVFSSRGGGGKPVARRRRARLRRSGPRRTVDLEAGSVAISSSSSSSRPSTRSAFISLHRFPIHGLLLHDHRPPRPCVSVLHPANHHVRPEAESEPYHG